MKKAILTVSSLLLLFSCNNEPTEVTEITIDENQKNPVTSEIINQKIESSLQNNASFNWAETNSNIIWSAIKIGNNLATIGFGNDPNNFDRSKTPNHQVLEIDILQTIAAIEGKKISDILIASDPFLNLIDVKIEKQETVIALRNNSKLRYIEPADYKFIEGNVDAKSGNQTFSASGCETDAETLNTTDYTTITPNAKVPWNFYKHNIPAAWEKSTGAGITIGIVDTGLSANQSFLGSNFNTGASSGRSVQRFGTFVDSVWPWVTTTDGSDDRCGHGTAMSSVATAPRNNAGLPVGVAYNSSLIVYRAAPDVLLEGYRDHDGVKSAFTALGNNSNVKIISMSMGYVFSVGKISDGVKYAHSKGKLIFCAGGTSTIYTNFVGVIFPASMAEAVAVTGIKESGYTKCEVCHSGSKIDFTVTMERNSGKHVPIHGFLTNNTDYVGGSSVATATSAGIAALVWAKNPSFNKDQVLNKMKQSSAFYPNKNAEFGYGNVNVQLAVQ